MGKTTLCLKLSYILHGGDPGWEDKATWDEVFDHTRYYPSKLMKLLVPNEDKRPKVPCAVWDATQMTAPADSSVPKVIRKLASNLTENRPECSVLIMNAPNINAISAPLRRLVAFEIIVWERGHYEVQQIIYHKNFKNPLQDLMNLVFIEGDENTTVFDPLPHWVQQRYDLWRAKEKAPFTRSLIRDLIRYEDKLDPGEDDTTTNVAFSATCNKCGYQWNPRNPNPSRCPRCQKRL